MSFVGGMGIVLTVLGLMGWSAFGIPAHVVGISMIVIASIWYIYKFFAQNRDL